MRLALAFREPDVRAFQASITSRQFTDWIAFGTLEPFGPLADEHRAGVLASAMAGGVPKGTAKDKVPAPADFFPTLKPGHGKPRQTPEDMMAVLRGIADRGFGTYTEGS